jgi:hypothetical protein
LGGIVTSEEKAAVSKRIIKYEEERLVEVIDVV